MTHCHLLTQTRRDNTVILSADVKMLLNMSTTTTTRSQQRQQRQQ